MVLFLPYMIMAIFYVGRATIKLIVALFAMIAVTFSLTIRAINWIASTVTKD